MSAHTRGPWFAKDTKYGEVAWVDDVNGLCIAECPTNEDGRKMIENARLIAAAPELLQALDNLLAEMEATGGWNGDEKFFDAGIAAIRKATEGA